MNADGTGQTPLTVIPEGGSGRGSSALGLRMASGSHYTAPRRGRGRRSSWTRALRRSAVTPWSSGCPPRRRSRRGADTYRLTNSLGVEHINDDPGWSPDGRRIAYTRHEVSDNHNNSVQPRFACRTSKHRMMGRRATCATTASRSGLLPGLRRRALQEVLEDGKRILYVCRLTASATPFQICVINADGTEPMPLTNNGMPHLTASWSPRRAEDHVPQATAPTARQFRTLCD
jgi:WD40-like Beta Propeller Repeat